MFNSFARLLTGLFGFCCALILTSLYIIDTNPFSHIKLNDFLSLCMLPLHSAVLFAEQRFFKEFLVSCEINRGWNQKNQ